MAVISHILPDRSQMSFEEMRQAAAAWLERTFVPREVILRAGGQVSYLRLSSRTQKLAALITGLVLAWGLYATASYVVHRNWMAAQDRTIANHEQAYRDLESEFNQALADQARLEAEMAGLSQSLGREIDLNGELAQHRAALERRITGLQQRLAGLRSAHLGVIEQFRELAMARADAIETTIAFTGLDAQMLVASVDQSNLGRGGPLIPIRQAAADPDRRPDLADALAGLNEQWDRLFALQEVRRVLPLTAPLSQFWISSGYGERDDPFTGERSFHAGVDMVAPLGTGIRATAPGTVAFAGKRKRYGRMIEIDHGHGITTRYAHLGQILVKEGAAVERGQRIATLGSSGRSTGPHLHYEIRSGGKTFNPVKFLEAGTRALEE
jgi:murein DD-endopeptidase MepM/ murein hydrolase activator NlpD